MLRARHRPDTGPSPTIRHVVAARPVLVVDDDPKIVELVRAYLDRAGYAVVTAADGEDALRQINEAKPSLIVLDVMLPGVDGLDLTRHLRDSHQTVPILMMSARGRVDDRIRGLVEAPMTTLPSHSARRSSWCGSTRSCGAALPATYPPLCSGTETWRSISIGTRSASRA